MMRKKTLTNTLRSFLLVKLSFLLYLVFFVNSNCFCLCLCLKQETEIRKKEQEKQTNEIKKIGLI